MANRKWEEDEITFLKENYGSLTCKEIGAKLNRSPSAVKTYAYHNKIPSSITWTEEDIKIVMSMFGRYSYSSIAKAVGKSKSAIASKICRMELGDFKSQTDEMTGAEVARLLGRYPSTIQRWIRKKELKATRRGSYFMVKPTELFKWMQNNPDRWSVFDITEPWYFENEPWYKEKLHEELDRRYA